MDHHSEKRRNKNRTGKGNDGKTYQAMEESPQFVKH